MLVNILSSKEYDDNTLNYGDCFIIDTNEEVVIYDCGCVEHAERVIEYLDKKNIQQVEVILSHNDKDHYEGIDYLIEKNRVSSVYTTLLLKHVKKLLDEIDDDRRNNNSIKEQIKERYSNISSLINKGILKESTVGTKIGNYIEIVGPTIEYIIEATAYELDKRVGDKFDNDTVVNATSIQVSINFGNGNLLLCGDGTFEAMEDNIKDYDIIQLPHHGREDQAKKIFEARDKDTQVLYIISDNTGESNGGSSNIKSDLIGKRYKNTLEGNISIDASMLKAKVVSNYGINI